MKRLFSYFTLFTLLVAGVVMSGCKKDPVNPSTDSSVKFALGAVTTNSAEVLLTTTNVSEYAYYVTDNMTESTPDASNIFQRGEKGSLSDGQNTVKIFDLEAGTDYKVFVTTKSAAGFGEVFTSDKFTTKQYTELVTIIETADYFSVKFHIEVPKGKTIVYAINNRPDYWERKRRGYADADLISGKGSSIALTESKTIEFNGWESLDPETGTASLSPILPGMGVVVYAAEAEWYVDELFGEEYYRPLFDFEKFSGGGGGGDIGGGGVALSPATRQNTISEEECWMTEYHATKLFNARAPQTLEATITVDVVKHTTRTFAAELVPEQSLLGFGYIWMTMEDWDTSVKECDYEGALTFWSLRMGLFDNIAGVQVDDLKPNVKYRLLLLGKGNDEGTLRSVQFYDFEAKVATKPLSEVIVTAIKAPAGYTESPWTVWFNIKSPTRDVVSAKFACNSADEIETLINLGGYTYDMLMTEYGAAMNPEAIAMINSDKGLDLSFDSWEDARTRLIVAGYNDEESSSEFNDNGGGWADNRTIEIVPQPAVSSTLFTDLLGDWTATAHKYEPKLNDFGEPTGEFVLSDVPVKSKVTITAGAPEYPSPMPAEVYDIYSTFSREEVDKLYADFGVSSEKFTRKIKGQNQLVAHGFDFNPWGFTQYFSPWSVFTNTGFMVYTTDDIFFDFGPKWFLQIAEGDRVTVAVDPSRITPLANLNMTINLGAANTKTYLSDAKEFDVTVSADKQTLTIEPIKRGADMFYPALLSYINGGADIYDLIHDVVLTRGWTEPEPEPMFMMPASLQIAKMARVHATDTSINNESKHYRKTRLPKSPARVFDYSKAEVMQLQSYRNSK